MKVMRTMSVCLSVCLSIYLSENVNLDDMKDEKERRRVEAMINNFGQTPTKLFNVRITYHVFIM